MIVAIDSRTLQVAFLWMIVGLVVYFVYSKKHSRLRAPGDIMPSARDFESTKDGVDPLK